MYSKRIYPQRSELIDGCWHFFVRVSTGNRKEREVEVSEELYLNLLTLQREDWQNEKLLERCFIKASQKSISGDFIQLPDDELSSNGDISNTLRNSEQLRAALLTLPREQLVRFVMHHGFKFTYRQLADLEGCSASAIEKSIAVAKKNLLRILRG
jgi:RNA polymerase sigma-70 factor (ECF subfamily)